MAVQGILEETLLYRPTAGDILTVPVLVVGGSTAAYSATLGALQAGVKVCLVQPQLVVGGQFTAQGLPASDDGRLLTPYALIPYEQRDPQQLRDSELFALSRSQRHFRQRLRQCQPVANKVIPNPGGSWVSHLSVTPVVAAACLNEGIQSYLEQGLLTLIPWAIPVQVLTQDFPDLYRRVTGVDFVDQRTQHRFTVLAQITIEATDLGDLLELANLPARVGQESRLETQEAVLPLEARPNCQQAITFCAVVERSIDDCRPLNPPLGYEVEPWLQSQDFTSVFWVQQDQEWKGHSFYDPDGIFRYRRLWRSRESRTVRAGDVTVLNWATSPLGVGGGSPDPAASLGCGNDYPFGVLVGVSRDQRQQEIQRACDRTQAFVHYLQTHGFPELKPRGDLTWTEDGIALEPYIREARRGIAITTIRHEDVAAKFFPGQARARTFADSVGIGQYHYLDVHPNNAKGHVELGDGHEVLPFTLPLSALIPLDTNGLILSSKSIGTTHITNAAYRMHPMEWAIGEAGGHLAAFALEQGVEIREVADQPSLRWQFQGRLTQEGIPIVWFNDLSHDDPDFTAIQVLSATGILAIPDPQTLNFKPQQPISRSSLGAALAKVLGNTATGDLCADVLSTPLAVPELEIPVAEGLAADDHPQIFAPEQCITHQELATWIEQMLSSCSGAVLADFPVDQQAVTHRDAARVLYRIWQWGNPQPFTFSGSSPL